MLRHLQLGPLRRHGWLLFFDLIGHPKASTGYAWVYDTEAGSRTLAVLQLPPVISPVTAVRAAIVGELRPIEGN